MPLLNPLPETPSPLPLSTSPPPLASAPPLSASPRTPPDGRWFLRPTRIVIFIVAIALVWVAMSKGLMSSKPPDVLTAVATRGELVITVTDRGELESARSITVNCEIEGGGKLVTIVPEGTRIKKGEEVARFDTDVLLKGVSEQAVKSELAEGKVKAAESEVEVQKNKAESEIAKAKLALTLANIDYKSYEEGEALVELDKRKGTLELGRKELKEAEDSLEFTRSLVKKGFGQMEQIRALELNAEGKRYDVRQKEADLRVFEKFARDRKMTELKAKAEDAQRELVRTEKIQAAATQKAENEQRATVKTAELEKKHLERLQAQLDKCILKAPQDGIVIYFKRPWDDESRIRPGATTYFQQPIFTLPDLDQMQVKLKVHESVVKKVQKEQTATMQVEALGNQVLHGEVRSVATLAQNDNWRGGGGVKEYLTEVSINDLPKDGGLRPGMTAEVKILIKTVHDALTVPVQSVTESRGQHVCYVVTPGGVERREVTIGEGNEQLIQILDGLRDSERVALDARSRAAAELKAGDPNSKKESPEKAKIAPAIKGLP